MWPRGLKPNFFGLSARLNPCLLLVSAMEVITGNQEMQTSFDCVVACPPALNMTRSASTMCRHLRGSELFCFPPRPHGLGYIISRLRRFVFGQP